MHRGNVRQFRTPAADEHAVLIVITTLLDRVVDPDGVDGGAARLHLALTPVNPRFVIHKLPRQMQTAVSPGQPEVVTRKRHQHRPHPEVDPAMRSEGSHAGIDKWNSCRPLSPSGQTIGIGISQVPHEGVKILPLDRWLILEFLDEMAVPVKS